MLRGKKGAGQGEERRDAIAAAVCFIMVNCRRFCAYWASVARVNAPPPPPRSVGVGTASSDPVVLFTIASKPVLSNKRMTVPHACGG